MFEKYDPNVANLAQGHAIEYGHEKITPPFNRQVPAFCCAVEIAYFL